MEFDKIPDTNLATSKEVEDWLLSTNRSIESELNTLANLGHLGKSEN